MTSKFFSALFVSLLSLPLAAQGVKPAKAEVLPVTEAIPDDPEIGKVIAPLAAEIKASFDQPLVQAPDGLARGRRGEENLLGYWVADVMRRAAETAVGAPVAFAITNSGGLRANLRPGKLKVGDIFEVMPFENELVVVELTGAEVVQVVKEGLLRRGGEPSSGVKAKFEGPADKAVLTVTWEDGRPIDPAAVVKVATSDYLYGGGDTIPTLRKGRKPFTTGLTLRQLLLDRCAELDKAKQPLQAPAPGRYDVPAPIQDAIRDKTLQLR
ncbi:5'-nucleotidase C-terminal domain-containing protein [Geothrix sp. 21YS21S-4]|uniref:5'-nucleotidase C-terminal domain-containing protein n=1 Tax=Geothrix sp. 21YS21S-4 TaxID=3068889 RepID=UPI0027B9B783|nr:5'-nucleotidase C-terminal domain-containing protein [Geothrix sp. 21YS21S-4]